MRQLNERDPSLQGVVPPCTGCVVEYGGPRRDLDGAYVFARYQLTQRGFLGARYDYVQDPTVDGQTLNAASGYLEFFPSEFSKLVLAYERLLPSSAYKALLTEDQRDNLNRILLQATFALGPHKPHPF
jgi:hypothetical protein